MPAFLEVRNMQKKFDRLEVLKGINFTVEKGEVLSIIGSSGSGKTTLLRCLNFLETPTDGEIYLSGELLYDAVKHRKLSEKELRNKRLHFGLVFQSFNLFPQYNVLKNITLAPKLIMKERIKKGLETTDIEQNALKLLERVGLSDKAKAYPCQLSGGQCQRVAIARALALNPDILCFDEPTSALDPELTGEVLKVIKSLKSGDTTMIIVTHEMEFARSASDRIIFMADGVIEEMGTPKEIFENPKSEVLRAFLQKAEEKI